MASVYKATNQILEETIALKLLLPGADELTRERFRQEARTVSKLAHPNIVRTFQVGQTSADGIAYIAMELVEGQSLSSLLESSQTLSVDDTSLLLEPVARALAYAHGLGVIHRDVKPSNILLRRVEAGAPGSIQLEVLDFAVVPLLSDFGIARALDSPELTSAGRTIGTPAYMAPEQCAGTRDIDGRADIYSLGTVLYRCLVGRPPFIGTTTQILHAHVYEPLTIPDEVVYALPPTVIEMLQYSLAKEVDKRYPSASMMADALLSVVDHKAALSTSEPAYHGGIDVSAPTRTMETLPTTQPHKVATNDGHTTSQQVLIPGALTGGKPRSIHGISGTPRSLKKVGSTSHQRIAVPMEPAASKQRETNWIGLVLGATLLLLLIFIGVALVRSVLPSGDSVATSGEQGVIVAKPTNTDSPTVTPSPTATEDEASAGDGTPTAIPTFADRATVAVVAVSSEPGSSATTSPSATAGKTEELESAAAEKTTEPTPAPTETATVEPTAAPPSLDVLSAWDDAQYFLKDRDWLESLQYLILVRRGDPEFKKEEVQTNLFDVYVGLATELIADALGTPTTDNESLNRAISNFEKALELKPEDELLSSLLDAAKAVANATNGNHSTTRTTLQQAHVAYAEKLFTSRAFCAATEQMITALTILYDLDLVEKLNTYAEKCPQVETGFASSVDFMETISGRFIYSTVVDEQNRVMVVPAEVDAESTLLIVNGARAALHPQGDIIAFYSDSPQEAISAFDLTAGLEPHRRIFQFLYQPESGRESPPSWNADGSRFAFSSNVESDRVMRIYWAGNNSSGEYRVIVQGREPDWHPTEDKIVFKGADPTGNNPGLYTVNLGTRQQRLTDDRTDSRPIWSPDGRYVLFMSNERDQNWDIYRVELATGVVARLTKDPATDGLPSVSPDGKHVAFLSDRDDGWQIWIVPIDGGIPQRLTSIVGDLPNWQEHSIQWVK